MSKEIICLSTNGVCQSTSRQAPVLLLIATIDGAAMYERADANAPWRQTDRVLKGLPVSSLAYEPKSGNLIAGLHYQGGIRVSTDGGKSWETRNNGLKSGHVYTLAIQYVRDSTIIYAGTEPAEVYRSEDFGRNWRALAPLNNVRDSDKWLFPHAVPHAKNIAFHPSMPETLYVCVEQGDLLRSDDAGQSWYQLDGFDQPGNKFRRDVHRVTVVPSDASRFYLTSGDGLYFATNGGKTWTQLTGPTFRLGYPDPFFLHPKNETICFMAGACRNPSPWWGETGTAIPAFMRSTDSGHTWAERMGGLPNPVPGNIEAAALHTSESGLEFFIGTARGALYTSRDEGASWELISNDLPPISKGPHFRHFLPREQRTAVEDQLRAINAFV